MKLESLSKSEKSNSTTFKMFDDDILLEKYVIVIFPIYSQFEQCRGRIPDVSFIFFYQ